MNSDGEGLRAIQIGMNSNDIVGSARLFAELGFHNAGGHMIWGGPMAIQGLASSARALMWWLVGRQTFVQLELFQHTEPMQRPLPADWRCSDLGWSRFGIAISRLDAAKTTLVKWGIPLTGECVDPDGTKRIAFREPFVGCFVELFEDGDGIPGGRRAHHHDLDPAIVYATSSVSDLAATREFYENVLNLKIVSDVVIHRPEHEALWELSGARSESFVVDGGGFLLEIVQYLDPVGRPKPDDYRTADQGLVNIALGTRLRAVAEEAVERVKQTGCHMAPLSIFGDACGTYVLEPEREFEIGAIPASLDAAFGFEPAAPFFGQQF